MARTWTQIGSVDIGTVGTSSDYPPAVWNGKAYFTGRDATGTYPAVWEWDPASPNTVTDIGDSNWNSGDYQVSSTGICKFGSTIYTTLTFDDGFVPDPYTTIWRYDGLSSWTEVEDFSATAGVIYGNNFDADNSRIVIGLSDSTGYPLYGSTDGTTWTAQTVSSIGSFYMQPYGTVGLTRSSSYGGLLVMVDDQPGDRYICTYNTSNDWSTLTAVAGVDSLIAHFIGYGEGTSFFISLNGATYYIAWSDDWGETYTETAIVSPSSGAELYDFGAGASGYAQLVSYSDDDGVSVWNSGTAAFVADGDTAPNAIVSLFSISGTLYAITVDDGATYTNLIYSGGAVPGAASTYALTHSSGGIPGVII